MYNYTQPELFRTSVLVEISGSLAMMSVDPSKRGPGKCPLCKGTKFQKDLWRTGWTHCECLDFGICTSHLDQIKEQWGE